MKKLLILLSLTTAITAFADAPTTLPASKAPQGNTEKSATMNIKATVIRPLNINKTGDMDFGKVIQGTTGTAESGYTITGEANQSIAVSISPLTTLTGTGPALPINLDYTLPTNIDASGNANFNISGTIRPIVDTHIGSYSGQITATVLYN